MDITKKELKLAVTTYCNQNFIKNLAVSKVDMIIICKNLGYGMPPYLATEAYLVACGGYAKNGQDQFSAELLYNWLLQRECRLVKAYRFESDLKPTH